MIIVLSSLGVTAVGVIIALIAVIAAFTANTTGNFSVTYTAINVKATVTMQYFYWGLNGQENSNLNTNPMPAFTTLAAANTVLTTDGDSSMVFTGTEEDETTTKAFQDIEVHTKELSRKTSQQQNANMLFIRYQIKNDSTTDNITLKSTLNTENIENASIDIGSYIASIQQWMWEDYEDLTNVVVAPETTYELMLRISMDSASLGAFDGSWNFVLSVAE